MSYDISIGDLSLNYTSNVVSMWDRAMPTCNLRDMRGLTGKDCLPHLLDGIDHMGRYYDIHKRMEPRNGWGSYEGALAVLVRRSTACEDYPNDLVMVSQ